MLSTADVTERPVAVGQAKSETSENQSQKRLTGGMDAGWNVGRIRVRYAAERLTCSVVVGLPGLEPGTSSSRTKRATKLRHTPREATTAYRTCAGLGERGVRPGAGVTDRSHAEQGLRGGPAWNISILRTVN